MTHIPEIVTDLRRHILERLVQHRDNLELWESGFLTPTEPDPEEREAVKRELRAALAELEPLAKMLGIKDECLAWAEG